jgi:hypothetical protein
MLRHAIAVILLAFAVPLGLGDAEMALPGIEITAPTDGTLLLDHAVDITGTSLDPVETWLQTSRADFDGGVMEDVVSTPSGDLAIADTYDDFDDGDLDTSRWSVVDYPGMNVTEVGGELRTNGTALTGMMYDYAYTAEAVSERGNLTMVSANLTSLDGTGSGHCAVLLIGTMSNYLSITIFNDSWGPRARAYAEWDGHSDGAMVDLSSTAPHQLMVYKDRDFWFIYIDGDMVYRGSQVTVGTGHLHLSASPKAYSDTVEATWDDVTIFPESGNYTSDIHDTGAPSSTMERVRWTATLPEGSTLEVSVRTASNQDMSDAAPWCVVFNDGYVGPLDRFVQYRLGFKRPVLVQSPVLHDIAFEIRFPVVKVEVSLDGSNWTLADGTEDWSVLLELPENRSTVWAKATDGRGSVAITSLTVDVDTTPPSGTVVIEGGAEATGDRLVHLDLAASDNYRVTDMEIGETPDLTAAAWIPFSTTWDWPLSWGDGPKTVYVRFRDSSGLASQVACDSIILDTAAPTGSLLINGGDEYARSTSVDLTFAAIDLSGIIEVQVWNYPDIGGASWRPFTPAMGWDLSQGSGTKQVCAILRDRIGHNSSVISDSIIQDMDPPTVDLSIDGGAPFTNRTLLEVWLNATDANGLADMQLSEDPSFGGAEWVPFRMYNDLQVSADEGPRTVHARVRDLAGNEGSASATILLDLTPPASTVDPLPSEVDSVGFNVSWSAADARSGVRDYDVQFKVGDGPWQEWYVGTVLTTSTFAGAYNRTYQFRVRATDVAGNSGAFPASGAGPVLVRPKPTAVGDPRVAILRPVDGSVVDGTITVEGNASHGAAGKHIVAVFVQVDSGDWKAAVGTTNWTFALDTHGLADGPHAIRARSSDGARSSTEAAVSVDVHNGGGGGKHEEGLTTPIAIIIIILVVLVVVALVAVVRARAGRDGTPPERTA